MTMWTNLQIENKECRRCPLRKGCNQVVPGEGLDTAKIFIVGEATSEDADIIGQPFAGRSGDWLNKILIQAGIHSWEVYTTYAVKCRPPKDRVPLKYEIQACKSWLWAEIQAVQPKVIITLGKLPTVLLLKLKTTAKLSHYIGQIYNLDYINSKLMPWFSLGSMLRSGNELDKHTAEWLKLVKETADEKNLVLGAKPIR